eukprot:TRINITY_DN1270_c0_g2_i2.p1 TRINITY_DN1270_c0_g2~~TRINITY_DN1270_c0_g2_i2.p1  ORF type:complete len:721 (+),score=189.94 TRINITY_DN1270_c0_g2_i2:646-2808(+)
MSVDLMMVKSGQRIQNVFPKYLTDIHPFMIGRHVTRKQPPKLVGTIDDVLCDVEVKFPDRSHCIIHGATPSTLKAMEDDVSEDEVEPERNYLYYPSQQVGVTQTVLDAAEWIIKPKANKNQRQKKTKQRVCGTVMKVTPVCVVVYWHNKKIEEEVDEKCSPDDLIVLNHFKHTKFEVGDYTMIHPQVRNYFLAFAKDGKPTPNQANTKAKSGGKGKRKEKRQDENEENDEEQDSLSLQISSTVSNHEELMSFTEGWTGSDGECAVITGTHTHVRVRWQDGRTEELWRPSTQFVPRKYLLNYEFGPGRFVHEEDRSELGIIKKVNQKEKTAVIQWTNQTGEIEEQEISVYDLEERPDKKFRLGGVVQSSKGDKVGEVVEVNGNEITVAWSTSEVEKAQYDDLQAIDTDEEDEGTEEEGQPSEVVEKDIVFEDYKEEEEADKHKQEQPTKFPSFALLEDCTHHHFLTQEPPPKLTRIANREWKRLEEELPPGIHVIGYTNKMHLLKALILGPTNTIYNNTYFLFDIALPKGYPHYPPKVYFHSLFKGKVNPNLQDDGNVCLSLLGTWSGEGSERWHPSRSSVLQLLVSIQGLVLGVKDPYFLEAGYEKLRRTKQGEDNSIMFNEKALVLSLKNTLKCYHLATCGSIEFAEFISSHFRQNYGDVVDLVEHCQRIIDNPERDEDDSVKKRFCLHSNPSRGFLLTIVNLKPKVLEVVRNLRQNTR